MRASLASSLFLVSATKATAFVWPRASTVLKHHQRSSFKNMSLRPSKQQQRAVSSSGPPPPSSIRGGAAATPLKASFFDNAPMFQGQSIIIGANVLGLVLSLVTTSHFHVDLLGTGAFAAAALPTLLDKTLSTRVRLSSAAVVAWGTKLAGFLFFRILQTGHDGRLDGVLSEPVYAAGFWVFSLAWGLLCSLPHALGTTSRAAGNPVALAAGGALFAAGILTETTADYQKWMFKAAHPGEFCNAGLWSLSQHPNWFGNLLLWTGILVMNASALVEPVVPPAKATSLVRRILSFKRVGIALLSPLFMLYLFQGQASGSITDSLNMSMERYGYGKNADFTKYIDTTPLIFPNPLKWFASK